MNIIEAELIATFIVKQQQQEVMRFFGDDGISLET